MKIIHAVANEHGTANGGVPGDQTGREIREQDWYDRPWAVYLEPPASLGQRAAEYARRICGGNFGYSQDRRWSGYAAFRSGTEGGDFDCSSLVASCYIFAGAPLKREGYTGNLERILKNIGFKAWRDEQHLRSDRYAIPGGVYLADGHTCICVPDEADTVSDDGIKRIRVLGSVWIHSAPDKEKKSRIPHPAQNGDVLTVVGQTEDMWQTERGWITSDEKYVREI